MVPSDENWPSLQDTQALSWVLSAPEVHSPLFCWPAEHTGVVHGTQVPPLTEYVPMAHGTQVLSLVLSPVLQARSLVLPAAHKGLEHGAQGVVPPGENWPRLQSTHALSLVLRAVVHAASFCLPAGQMGVLH